MAKIYKRTDRIPVKIGDITVKLSPLSAHEKAEVQTAMLKSRATLNIKEATVGVILSLKYSVKGIEGVQDSDGNDYKLKFDDTGYLSDESIDDLLNMELTEKLVLVCAGLLKGIPSEFTDNTGKKLDGVEIVKSGNQSPN